MNNPDEPGWVFRVSDDIFNIEPQNLIFLKISDLEKEWIFEDFDVEHPPQQGQFGQIGYPDGTFQDAEYETTTTFANYLRLKRKIIKPKVKYNYRVKKQVKNYSRKMKNVKRKALETISEENERERKTRRRRGQ
jgi:hypothetical protein